MIYLGIRTETPVAHLVLYKGGALLAKKDWQADRELAHYLLAQLETFLGEHDLTFAELSGLFVFKGPGSFTGLRIGITVMNTISYAQTIPIIGVSGDSWHSDGAQRLAAGENDHMVMPEYGADARVTTPRK